MAVMKSRPVQMAKVSTSCTLKFRAIIKKHRAPPPPRAHRPDRRRTGWIRRGSTVVWTSAAAGRMRLTRRADTMPASSATTTPVAAEMGNTHKLVQALVDGGRSW